MGKLVPEHIISIDHTFTVEKNIGGYIEAQIVASFKTKKLFIVLDEYLCSFFFFEALVKLDLTPNLQKISLQKNKSTSDFGLVFRENMGCGEDSKKTTPGKDTTLENLS